MSRGILITFEGGEGTGKSTHIRFVTSYLRKKRKKVVVAREPGSTPIGEQIRSVLLHPKNKRMSVAAELFLYLAARAQLVEEIIRPALKQGKIVISDRFEDSTMAYQGYAGRFPMKTLKRLCKASRGTVMPRLTFLLDVDVRTGLKRSGRGDRMEQKSVGFHERIRRGYLQLAKRNQKRIKVISTRLPKKEVERRIQKELDRVFA